MTYSDHHPRIELCCFDMAGTTVEDGGLVFRAFQGTIEDLEVAEDDHGWMTTYVLETMGQSKIDVFTHLFGERAALANARFEHHFVVSATEHGVEEIPGATACFEALAEAGIALALTTGFSPATREVLLEMLDWGDRFVATVSPADVGRGRPAPDMVLSCAMAAKVTSVMNVAVVGDTWSDMAAGHRAGASRCLGVLSGTDLAERLVDGGATTILASVATAPPLLVGPANP